MPSLKHRTPRHRDLGIVRVVDRLSIYDANNTRITVSRRAVLEGWHSEHEGIWRILLGKQREDIKNKNSETVLVSVSPLKN